MLRPISSANPNNWLNAIILNSKKKYAIGFGFDIKQSNIEDIGISFENRFKTRNVFKNGENLEDIIDSIKSKGGTTEAGLNHLYSKDFTKVFSEAVDAAVNRAKELSMD